MQNETKNTVPFGNYELKYIGDMEWRLGFIRGLW